MNGSFFFLASTLRSVIPREKEITTALFLKTLITF